MSSSRRNPLIDCCKGIACIAIIWHHLAFYGPMADVAHPAIGGVIDWLVEYARMAVQVFLVLGGYLAAASLAPQGHARFDLAWPKLSQRFVRLVVPYVAALLLAMLVAELVRPWFDDEAVPASPGFAQLLSHVFLLQGVLGKESLSAGVWYVAIDFQLFALTTLVLAWVRYGTQRWAAFKARIWPASAVLGARQTAPSRRPAIGQLLVVAGCAASLLFFNRDAAWDVWAFYFFGAYGMGMTAYWATHSTHSRGFWAWTLLLAVLLSLALWLEWRDRIAVAGTTALVLIFALRWQWLARWGAGSVLQHFGQMSYSVFLVHFAVCLLVNAVESWLWPSSVPASLIGMLLAFVLSVAAGRTLYLQVERHVPQWQAALGKQAKLIGLGFLATGLSG